MTHKCEAAYMHIFEYIKENVLSLEGRSFMTDFEIAPKNTLRRIYPQSRLNSCWFHFKQAVRRKSHKFSKFREAVKNVTEIRRFYYKLMALPLLPSAEIINAFGMLKLHALTQHEDACKEFLAYFEKQWIRSVSQISIYVIN